MADQIIAILPTGEWAFVKEQADVSFYKVTGEGAEEILAGKMVVDHEDLGKLQAVHIGGHPLEE